MLRVKTSQLTKPFNALKSSYHTGCFKVACAITAMLSPIVSFAASGDAPTNPFGTMGQEITNDKDGIVHGTGVYLEKVFSWIGIAVGAIVLIGAIIFIWNTVNMPKEEKEHHNIPVRIFMGLGGAVVSIAIVAFLLTAMAANK